MKLPDTHTVYQNKIRKLENEVTTTVLSTCPLRLAGEMQLAVKYVTCTDEKNILNPLSK